MFTEAQIDGQMPGSLLYHKPFSWGINSLHELLGSFFIILLVAISSWFSHGEFNETTCLQFNQTLQ